MKKRRNYLKIGVLIICVSILLSNCSKEEYPDIEKKKIKTVEINEALNFLKINHPENLKNSLNTEYVSLDLNGIHLEDIKNSEEFITVLPATTKFKDDYSRIILLNIDDQIRSVVFSMIESPYSSSTNFSGLLYISDLDGNFITGYRVRNGISISYFVRKNIDELKSKSLKEISNPEGDGDEELINYYINLEEVVITAPKLSPVRYYFLPYIMEDQEGDQSGDSGSWEYYEPEGGGDPDSTEPPCADGYLKDIYGNCVLECEVTIKDLKNLFPGTDDRKLATIANLISGFGLDYGFDSNDKLQHFLSQTGAESGGLEDYEESVYYRWEGLGQEDRFNKYFNPYGCENPNPKKANPEDYKLSSSSVYVDPEPFFNYVYGSRNGNNLAGDGYKYRGRGIIQLTGRANYEAFADHYKSTYDSTIDILANPELLSQNAAINIISALWFFSENVLKSNYSSTISVKKVTKKINGGSNGLDKRESIHAIAVELVDCDE